MAKSRIFNIMQYENHPDTKEPLITEQNIINCIQHKTIGRWAYICHDEDVYSEQDEIDDPTHIAGTFKPRHWHIVLETKTNRLEIGTIAKWLGIPDNFIDIPKGHGAFLDCVQYLTHEKEEQQRLGKRLYLDDRVKSNFDFRAELDKRAENIVRYGRDLSLKDKIRNDVLYHGMSLKEVIQKYPIEYQNDMTQLEKFRLKYLSEVAVMTPFRINFYVEGAGGAGKGLTSRAIARCLIDRDGTMRDDEIFFQVGADKTSFEGYDGQPVIIWNDCRALTLINKLGGRENVFNVFDPFPPDIRQNIKFGAIRLNNCINIVNSVQPWDEFLDGLAGEYKDRDGNYRLSEDKGQSYRRFPIFIRLHEEDYDLGINVGFFYGTREYEQYMIYDKIKANFQKIVNQCGNNYILTNKINRQALAPVIEKYDMAIKKVDRKQTISDEEIQSMFSEYGIQTDNTNSYLHVTSIVNAKN